MGSVSRGHLLQKNSNKQRELDMEILCFSNIFNYESGNDPTIAV